MEPSSDHLAAIALDLINRRGDAGVERSEFLRAAVSQLGVVDRAVAEGVANRLIAVGMVHVHDDYLVRTSLARDLWRPLRRQTNERRWRTLEATIAEAPLVRGPVAWSISACAWSAAETRATAERHARLETRIQILEGLLRALASLGGINAVVGRSPDAQAARRVLIEHLGYSDVQAQHILDMPVRLQTADSRAQMAEELGALRNELAVDRGAPRS